MNFFVTHQLNIMMFLSGICFIIAIMVFMTESLSPNKKRILAIIAFSALFLINFDRAAYIYRGDMSNLGFAVVRVSNFMVFFLQIFIAFMLTQFIKDLLRNEGRLPFAPILLRISDILFVLGASLIIVSQITGLYYTISPENLYVRSSGFIISYIFPFLIVLLQEVTIIQYRKRLNTGLVVTLALSIAFPSIMSIVQIFTYGISLGTMSMAVVVILFYIYALKSLGWAMEKARKNELESYLEVSRREASMFEQTAEALANAIDAKDNYTHGHSTRVAEISRQIAEADGSSEEDCAQIYFAALLHDVGKIGIRHDIINKEGRLTDEEFEQIKSHTVLGYHILSSIRQSPTLSVGAHYHHERYDGKGYPDGLRGEDIPRIARIIAVADAYDAMTSTRSYRASLSMEETKKEIINGMGRQFDPIYAELLLRIIAARAIDK